MRHHLRAPRFSTWREPEVREVHAGKITYYLGLFERRKQARKRIDTLALMLEVGIPRDAC